MTPTSGTHTIYSTIFNGRAPEESWSVLKLTLKSSQSPLFFFTQEAYIQKWDSQAKADRAAQITATLANRIYVPNKEGCIGPFISVNKDKDSYTPLKIYLKLQSNDTCDVEATPLAFDSITPTFSHDTFEKAAEIGRFFACIQKIPEEVHFFYPPIKT